MTDNAVNITNATAGTAENRVSGNGGFSNRQVIGYVWGPDADPLSDLPVHIGPAVSAAPRGRAIALAEKESLPARVLAEVAKQLGVLDSELIVEFRSMGTWRKPLNGMERQKMENDSLQRELQAMRDQMAKFMAMQQESPAKPAKGKK